MNLSPARRALAWKLNWFRQSELEGALLLGRVAGMAESRPLNERLIRHCAEEAQHAQLWAEAIAELDLPHIRIFRSYQSFYLQHTGAPASLLEVLAFTQIFERRVHRRFLAELQASGTPPAARRAFRIMIHDEKDHLAWVAGWLRDQPEAPEALARYGRADEAVYRELAPREGRLWEIRGLGQEPPEFAHAFNTAID